VVENAKRNPVADLLESIVTVIIVLVIIQTFLEDFAVVQGWSQQRQRILLFTGFFFDLFFTVEFLVRLYNSMTRRAAAKYLFRERGWIDFLASVPLLMLSSGPPVLAYLFAETAILGFGGILNMLKLIKAIRIARILRLLRIVKIFRSIKYADSPMAQRHMARIITISTTIIVFCFAGYSILGEAVPTVGVDSSAHAVEQHLTAKIEESDAETVRDDLGILGEYASIIRRGGETMHARYDTSYYRENFQVGDYALKRRGETEVIFDRRIIMEALAKSRAWQNLFFFGVVVLMIMVYLVFYSPHFALTVSDPIHVMYRGLSERDYNLEVKIPEPYAEDDVFRLADAYNEVFLPLKDRTQEVEAPEQSELKLDDIKDILD